MNRWPLPFTVLLTLLALWVGVLSSNRSAIAQFAPVCPSPLPTCSSSGPLSDLPAGSYACTGVTTRSDGIVKGEIVLVTSDGAGNISGKSAQNKNDSVGTTFKDFSQISSTYCVNTDDTGYITPSPTSNGCPLAFVIDSGRTEARLLSTEENQAQVLACKKQ